MSLRKLVNQGDPMDTGPAATEAGDGEEPFWRRKSLAEMTQQEWESLCDGCGKCCLVKLEDIDTGDLYHSRVACRLLDTATCRCTNYAERQRFVPDCVVLTPENILDLPWIPASCAYRKLAEGEQLEWWHPLISGDPQTVRQAGISAAGHIISEVSVDESDVEDYLIGEDDDWVP